MGWLPAEATSRCCLSGFRVERLRQQVVRPGRVANSQIELCEAEPLLGIVSHTEPELRGMIGERLGVRRGQLVIAVRSPATPNTGLIVPTHFAEDARKLRRVVGIVGRDGQWV